MHTTIQKFHDAVLAHDHDSVPALMAENIKFQPPTYWATWNGRDAVAAVLGHVNEVFTDFEYRRVMGAARIGRWNSGARSTGWIALAST